MMIDPQHVIVVVHHIAQLAILAYCGVVMRYVCCCFVGAMIVRIYSPLARYKADQDNPAVYNMALTFVHCQTLSSIYSERFPQKYLNPRSNCHCLVTMSL